MATFPRVVDRNVQHPSKVRLTQVEPNVYNVKAEPGMVMQEGTPLDSTLFENIASYIDTKDTETLNGAKSYADTKDTALLDRIYPIGSVYMSFSPTSPSGLFGGAWEALTGVFPYFNNGTTVNKSPKHNHTLGKGFAKVTTSYDNMVFAYSKDISFEQTFRGPLSAPGTSSSGAVGDPTDLGGSTDDSVCLPPYQEVYAWHRTA